MKKITSLFVAFLFAVACMAQQVVTPPTNLQTQDYTYTATKVEYTEDGFKYSDINLPAKVGIMNGSEIYIQGMCEFLPEAWVKGTFNGEEAVLESGQYYGPYSDEDGEHKLYFASLIAGTDALAELILDYNRQTGEYQGTRYVLLNSEKDSYAPYFQYTQPRLVRNPNAIESISLAQEVINTEYVDISGRRVEPSFTDGIVIKKETLADGQIRISKQIK